MNPIRITVAEFDRINAMITMLDRIADDGGTMKEDVELMFQCFNYNDVNIQAIEHD